MDESLLGPSSVNTGEKVNDSLILHSIYSSSPTQLRKFLVVPNPGSSTRKTRSSNSNSREDSVV